MKDIILRRLLKVDYIMENTNLIRLLKLTADNKSAVVQALRKEVVKCFNAQEAYMSELDMINSELIVKCMRYDNYLTNLIEERISVFMTNKTEPEKCLFNPKYKILFETPTYLA